MVSINPEIVGGMMRASRLCGFGMADLVNKAWACSVHCVMSSVCDALYCEECYPMARVSTKRLLDER